MLEIDGWVRPVRSASSTRLIAAAERMTSSMRGRLPGPIRQPLAKLVPAGLIALRSIFGEAVFATWEEAELMEVAMLSERGTADAEELGVTPRRMGDVLAET